jgi:hypothetical protein
MQLNFSPFPPAEVVRSLLAEKRPVYRTYTADERQRPLVVAALGNPGADRDDASIIPDRLPALLILFFAGPAQQYTGIQSGDITGIGGDPRP